MQVEYLDLRGVVVDAQTGIGVQTVQTIPDVRRESIGQTDEGCITGLLQDLEMEIEPGRRAGAQRPAGPSQLWR